MLLKDGLPILAIDVTKNEERIHVMSANCDEALSLNTQGLLTDRLSPSK